jgi:cobalamin biosynthesis protein CbiD
VDVKPPAGTKANVNVQSPSATASVRGTSFEFDTFNLKVNEGMVAFQGKKGVGILIPAGMASSIDDNDKAIDPLEAGIPETQKSLRRPSMPSHDIDLTFTW